jgi:cation:H+ antiporter
MISPFIIFVIAATIVVIAADRLAKYGDIISVRTGLGGLFVGTILLAGATSLPELIASISSFQLGEPNLAAGNFFGSNMVNVMLLAIVDVIYHQVPLIRSDAISQTMTAVLGILLMAMAVIFIMADMPFVIGWVGVDSIALIVLYFGGVWLIQTEGRAARPTVNITVEIAEDFPTLRRGVIGFLVSAGILVAVVPQLVTSATAIAEISGLGTSFVGTALLSLVTSLPELLAAFAAVRIGAVELAVGNLFGSTVFNMLGLGVADFFFTEGRLLGAIDPTFELVGMLGLVLTTLAVIGNLARVERRLFFIEIDALVIIVSYFAGMYLLFIRGLGG